MVVMHREDYQSQYDKLLVDKDTYKEIGINNNLPSYSKKKFRENLRPSKTAGHIDPNIYNKLYPTSNATPRFYTTPKIHNDTLKMRPIASGINSITYHLARLLTDILKPLVGKKSTHTQNSKHLVDN